jgi:hypothetical protein
VVRLNGWSKKHVPIDIFWVGNLFVMAYFEEQNNLVGFCYCNPLDLYSGGACFESVPKYNKSLQNRFDKLQEILLAFSGLLSKLVDVTRRHSTDRCYRKFKFRNDKTQSSPVNCYWPSPAESFLVSSPAGTHDLIYVRSKTVYEYVNGAQPSTRRGVCLSE